MFSHQPALKERATEGSELGVLFVYRTKKTVDKSKQQTVDYERCRCAVKFSSKDLFIFKERDSGTADLPTT
jgi:hypothetical protein